MKATPESIRLAVRILKNGGIVAYPTESSYALGCDAANAKAVKRIYSLKRRPGSKQLTFIVGSARIAGRYAILGRAERNAVKKLMPGRITLVAKAKHGGEFAFRIPSHPVALKLAKAFGKPLTATSANISGRSPIFSPEKIAALYCGKIGMILDDGTLPERAPSTVADLFGGVNIRRRGPVSRKQIEDAL